MVQAESSVPAVTHIREAQTVRVLRAPAHPARRPSTCPRPRYVQINISIQIHLLFKVSVQLFCFLESNKSEGTNLAKHFLENVVTLDKFKILRKKAEIFRHGINEEYKTNTKLEYTITTTNKQNFDQK